MTSILNGKRSISPDTALRLARYFGNSAQFWMNMQTRYDLLVAERQLGKRIKAEVDHAEWRELEATVRRQRAD